MTTGKSRILAFHPKSYGTLKAAVRALLSAVGGETRAAGLCRVSKSTLSEYGNPTYPDRHMPVDVALDLEKAAGAMPVSEHMAAAHGALLIRLPPIEAGPEWLGHVTAIGKEAGDVFRHVGEVLAGGKEISPRDAPTLLQEIDELLIAAATMRAAVTQRLAGETAS
jgi:hypothetical protein